MDEKETIPTRVKNFVRNHKVAIAVVSTAAVTTAVILKTTRSDVRELNTFLEEKGLFDEFYNPEA